jgi:hypothetical protein
MLHNDKVKAIQFIRPDAEFVLSDDELTWLDDSQAEPTRAEIAAAWIAYKDKQQADKAAAESVKATARAKLEALGITADDLKALGL